MTYRTRLPMSRESFKAIHRDLRLNPIARVFSDFRFSVRVHRGISYFSFSTSDTATILNLAAEERRSGNKKRARAYAECAREIREINTAAGV